MHKLWMASVIAAGLALGLSSQSFAAEGKNPGAWQRRNQKNAGGPATQGFAKGKEAWQMKRGQMGTAATQANPAATQPVEGVTLLEKPYAPLMAVIGGGCQGSFTDEQIKQIADTWQMVNGHSAMLDHKDISKGFMPFWAGPSCGKNEEGLTIGERIKKIKPDFVLSNYRNGSYVAQFCPNEAEEAESRFPLAISIWNTSSTLLSDISATDTSITATLCKIPTGEPEIKGGRPAWYPFKKSTAQGDYTKTTKEYVSWIRLGDEILRVEAVSADDKAITMQVRRGIWGTQAVDHKQGDPVFQPINIGRNMGIDKGDGALGGRADDPSNQPGLRYAFMTYDPKYIEWLAEKAKVIFDEGYDVCWLDVSVSTWYNNANMYGDQVTPWNVKTGAPLTNDQYREWQQLKVDGLDKILPGKKWFINNVKGGNYFDNGHDRYQLSGEGGHRPVDGGSMEMYANTREEKQWRAVAEMTLDFVNSKFWGVAWSKGSDAQRYRRFSYATFLLAYAPGEKLYFAAGEGGGLLGKMQPLFYYDLGEPVQRYKSVDEAKMPGQEGIYHRDFAKAKIVLNPTTEKKGPIALDKEYIDTETHEKVKEVTLEPSTAKILLVAE